MRLTDAQVKGLIQATGSFMKSQQGQLRLFGSRVRDDLKGGDIDLLLLVETDKIANKLLEQKHEILAAMKKYIGDQKIDLKISTQDKATDDSFLQMIMPESVILHRWE